MSKVKEKSSPGDMLPESHKGMLVGESQSAPHSVVVCRLLPLA